MWLTRDLVPFHALFAVFSTLLDTFVGTCCVQFYMCFEVGLICKYGWGLYFQVDELVSYCHECADFMLFIGWCSSLLTRKMLGCKEKWSSTVICAHCLVVCSDWLINRWYFDIMCKLWLSVNNTCKIIGWTWSFRKDNMVIFVYMGNMGCSNGKYRYCLFLELKMQCTIMAILAEVVAK